MFDPPNLGVPMRFDEIDDFIKRLDARTTDIEQNVGSNTQAINLLIQSVTALEAHANAPTSDEPIVDPRWGECPSPRSGENGYHSWRIRSKDGNPIGRECATCPAEQVGLMIWEPLPSADEN